MKRIAFVAVVLLAGMGLVACAPGASDAIPEYELTLEVAPELDSVAFSQEVKFQSDGTAAVFNLWANAYREGAANPAFYTPPARYGGIQLNEVAVNGNAVEAALDESGEHLEVAHGVDAGKPVHVSLSGTVQVPTGNYRLGVQDGVMKFLNAYPILAVHEDGGARRDGYCRVGDPFYAEAADYTVHVQAPADAVVALSADSRTDTIEGDTLRVEAKISGIRDFALVVARGYTETTAVVGETLVRYYARSESEERANLSADALARYGQVLGDYPWHQYSVVEAPFYYGGMEYGAFSLIADDIGDWREVLLHETAHQWFYGVVGSNQIDQPWLDEGLATFMSQYYLLLAGDEGGYNASVGASKRRYANFVNANVLVDPEFKATPDRPIGEYDTNYAYSMLVYTKTGLMYDALYQLLGRQKLEAGLQEYCRANAGKIAHPDDLYGAFRRATGQDVRGLMEPWLNDKVAVQSFAPLV